MRWIFGLALLLQTLTLWSQEASTIESVDLEVRVVEWLEYHGGTVEPPDWHFKLSYQLSMPPKADLKLRALNLDYGQVAKVGLLTSEQDIKSHNLTGSDKLLEVVIPKEEIYLNEKGELTLYYTTPFYLKENDFDISLPIVFPELRASNTEKDFFTASIQLDTRLNIYESFPTVNWSKASTGNTSVHTFSLQAIPSMISIKGGLEAKPVFSLLSLVDLLVALALLILFFLGWKKIKAV